MIRIEHAQTILTEEDILKLKAKTGISSIKNALAKAVEHYLECKFT